MGVRPQFFRGVGLVGRDSPPQNGDSPPTLLWGGLLIWQRPTLAGPVVRLPLALRRFTSVFGMGTGGSTALWSPEAGRGKLMVEGMMVDGPCNAQTGTTSGLAMGALGAVGVET